jgi:hypothetical protein
MKRLAVIFAATAALGVWPAASNAATFKGVVVAHQRGAVLVVSPAGSIHAISIRAVSGSAALGARVALSGGHATVVGRAHTARIRGIVVRRIGTTVFLSSNKHLVAVHTGRRLASASDTTPAPATPTTPAPGDVVSSTVTIRNGELDEDTSDDLGSSGASTLQVQATVSAVGAGTVTLTVGTQTLTVPLPGGLTLPASLVGQTVTLSLSLNDDNANGDDDNGDDDGGDDHGGSSGHGGHDG